MIGIDAIRARAEATLALVAELRRGGVIGAAVEAALVRSLNGQLVPLSAVWTAAGLTPVVPTVDEHAARAAREDVVRAVLRVLTAERTEPHAHSDDDAWYAEEQLDEAAKRLAAAVNGDGDLAKLREERDRLRMAIIAWRFLDSVDEYHREERLYELAAELCSDGTVLPSDEEMFRALDPQRAAIEHGPVTS